MRFGILEYSGVAIANSLDGAAAATQGTGASLNSGIITTTASGDLVLAGMSAANAANFTAGGGSSSPYLFSPQTHTKKPFENWDDTFSRNKSSTSPPRG